MLNIKDVTEDTVSVTGNDKVFKDGHIIQLIKEKEILKAIYKLKLSKVPESDKITAEMLI